MKHSLRTTVLLGLTFFCALNGYSDVGRKPSPGIVIDGAKEPDRISDTSAWYMLFRVVADDSSNGLTTRARANYLRPSTLTDDEINLVMEIARDALNEIGRMEAGATSRIGTMNYTLDMTEGRNAIITHSTALIVEKLGSKRSEVLRAFILERIKRRMRVTE